MVLRGFGEADSVCRIGGDGRSEQSRLALSASLETFIAVARLTWLRIIRVPSIKNAPCRSGEVAVRAEHHRNKQVVVHGISLVNIEGSPPVPTGAPNLLHALQVFRDLEFGQAFRAVH